VCECTCVYVRAAASLHANPSSSFHKIFRGHIQSVTHLWNNRAVKFDSGAAGAPSLLAMRAEN
jgi:phosphotransferase system HPr-like phosphotransfer protein